MALCIVSFVDWSRIRHSVEVEADGLFEAVVLAVKTFKQHDCDPGDATLIEVEVRSSVTHTITLRRVTDSHSHKERLSCNSHESPLR